MRIPSGDSSADPRTRGLGAANGEGAIPTAKFCAPVFRDTDGNLYFPDSYVFQSEYDLRAFLLDHPWQDFYVGIRWFKKGFEFVEVKGQGSGARGQWSEGR